MQIEKNTLRKRMIALRKEISIFEKQHASNVICKTLEQQIRVQFPSGARILFFAPREKEHEPNIRPLFTTLASDYICLFPKITDSNQSVFEAFPVNDLVELKLSEKNFRLPEPVSNDAVHPREIDLVLVPAVAIDRQGNRIGHGHGYFDRFLARGRKDCQKWAVIFACQKIERVPVESHDVPMDAVVDEEGIVYF